MSIIPSVETREKWVKKAREVAFLIVIVEILLIIAFALGCRYDIIKAEGEKLIIPVSAKEKPIPALDENGRDAAKDRVDEIADTIWMLESSRGVNNYSKCEAVGKTNGIGFGIPGNGKYQCFESHAEEMRVLKSWIKDKQGKGMSETELLCHYSGSNYSICQKKDTTEADGNGQNKAN